MLGIIGAIVIAIVTGLIGLAYNNPKAYTRVSDKLCNIALICFVGMSASICGAHLALTINKTEPNPEYFSEFQISILQHPFISMGCLLGIYIVTVYALVWGGYEVRQLKRGSEDAS